MNSESIVRDKNEIDVYRKLQEHLDQQPVGFPATKSGVEIRILKRFFTPEEARIALMLKFSWKDLEPLEEIHERASSLGISLEELETLLDNMADKGAIMALKKGDTKTYGIALFAVGIFEFQVNKLTMEFVEEMHQYWNEAFAKDMIKVPIPQLRTVPVGLNVDHELDVVRYDDIKLLFDNVEGPFVAINCVCRQAKDLFEDPCEATKRREVCMSFGHAAQMYIDKGWGRQISRNEALEILKQNEEDGLIFQPANAQKIDFICNCCTCCCEGMSNLNKLPNPGQMVRTNYYAEIEEESCTGCGTCIDRCQLGAISLDDAVSSINRKRCIGCGNCVVVCPSDAIILRRKDKIREPPMTGVELYDIIAQRKLEIKEKELKKQARKERRRK